MLSRTKLKKKGCHQVYQKYKDDANKQLTKTLTVFFLMCVTCAMISLMRPPTLRGPPPPGPLPPWPCPPTAVTAVGIPPGPMALSEGMLEKTSRSRIEFSTPSSWLYVSGACRVTKRFQTLKSTTNIPGLVTNSILFCWLFSIKDRWKKCVFNKRTIKVCVSCCWRDLCA